jgi:hypothetical protein
VFLDRVVYYCGVVAAVGRIVLCQVCIRYTYLMMRNEIVPETSVSFIHMTRLIVREDFIESCRRGGFGSYTCVYIIGMNFRL